VASAAPLANRRIVVTRAAEQAGELVDLLRAAGACPIVCPLIALAPPFDPAPLDAAIAQLHTYDWLFVTSANTVAALLARSAQLGVRLSELRPRQIAAVGPATARALQEAGLLPDLVPAAQSAAGLLAAVGIIEGQRVFLPQADIARPELAEGLRARGADVAVVTAYRTIAGEGVSAAIAHLRAGVDAIMFTSPSTVRALRDGAAQQGCEDIDFLLAGAVVACIGPTTAAALTRADIVAAPHTAAGMVDALLRWFTAYGKSADHG
jgi:uroporphyrinogen-III synthase